MPQTTTRVPRIKWRHPGTGMLGEFDVERPIGFAKSSVPGDKIGDLECSTSHRPRVRTEKNRNLILGARLF